MSQKLTTQALTEMLAKEAGINKRAADTFVKAFIQTVIEGGIKDGNVKIKGLGTFKVTQVADRESADVNTGKRIVIAGYKKMSFSTDINMDEAYESVDDTDIKENQEEAKADKPKTKTKATKTAKEKKEPAKASKNQDNNSVIPENEKEIQNEITEQIPVAPIVASSTKEDTISAEPELPETEVVNESPIHNLISQPEENEAVDNVISDNTDDTAEEETNEELTQVEETPVTEPVVEVIPSESKPTEVENEPTEEGIKPAVVENKTTEIETESAKVEIEPIETKAESAPTEPQPTKVEIEPTKATDSSKPTTPTSTATSSVQPTKKLWIWGAVAIACVIICAIIILATGNSSSENKDNQATTEMSQNEVPKDSVVTNDNKPEDNKVSKPKVHILQKGESLTTISVMYYHTKDSMGAIWKLNKFKNPNDIPLGTEIKLP